MKNALLLLFAFLISGTVTTAQTDKQIEEISDKTCECLQKKSKELKESSSNELQMELGFCMIGAAGEAGVDIDLSDASGLERLGQRVGLQMTFSCPDFMEMLGQMMNDDPEMMEEIMSEDHDLSFMNSKSNGQVLEVSSSDFVTLKIKSETGRKETYYWMEYFEGASLLENDGAAIKGKNISVSYRKVESYSPKLEDYVQIRVLRSLEIVE
ncbi:MAG: hypothetical protein P8P74_11255 [Crocinitomicaceae bacterium]|nr:hypothetical protein [Crocinitomicaceae bacterium]